MDPEESAPRILFEFPLSIADKVGQLGTARSALSLRLNRIRISSVEMDEEDMQHVMQALSSCLHPDPDSFVTCREQQNALVLALNNMASCSQPLPRFENEKVTTVFSIRRSNRWRVGSK